MGTLGHSYQSLALVKAEESLSQDEPVLDLGSLCVSELGVIQAWHEVMVIGELGFIPGWDEAFSAS